MLLLLRHKLSEQQVSPRSITVQIPSVRKRSVRPTHAPRPRRPAQNHMLHGDPATLSGITTHCCNEGPGGGATAAAASGVGAGAAAAVAPALVTGETASRRGWRVADFLGVPVANGVRNSLRLTPSPGLADAALVVGTAVAGLAPAAFLGALLNNALYSSGVGMVTRQASDWVLMK